MLIKSPHSGRVYEMEYAKPPFFKDPTCPWVYPVIVHRLPGIFRFISWIEHLPAADYSWHPGYAEKATPEAMRAWLSEGIAKHERHVERWALEEAGYQRTQRNNVIDIEERHERIR